MRHLLLGAVIACQGFTFASQSECQETKVQPERLHFSMPFPAGHKVIYELVASSAQRVPSSTEVESVLKLRGDVEVTIITCRPTGNVCDKSPMVLRADAVDYNERTGEIQTHGDVHIVLIDPVSKTMASN
jgi:lipopolysaccharide assembly outer membrane protein LptD (OstA)